MFFIVAPPTVTGATSGKPRLRRQISLELHGILFALFLRVFTSRFSPYSSRR
jgi:hypothetical protein